VIPRIVHFVFGLRDQDEPFHFLHYAALESCRRVLAPEAIYFHHKYLPWGPWWERIHPHLVLVEIDHVEEVMRADYSAGYVPTRYRYAHHADFIRLDVLIRHGGLYADIDTIFIRPFPDELFEAPFVIGREPSVPDERTRVVGPSLCNALLMAEPGSEFANEWRARMAGRLNGTWNNHSGFLAAELSESMSSCLRIEPQVSFFAFGPDRAGLARLLEQRHDVPPEALSVHLWAHLWWEHWRNEYSEAHVGAYTPSSIARTNTTLADLVRIYLPSDPATNRNSASLATSGWFQLSRPDLYPWLTPR
jgi:hypothetical protein